MNDFTKQDLYLIEKSVRHYLFRYSEVISDDDSPLLTKIQSLIDNYCEHATYYDYDDCADYCKKCDKKIAVDRRIRGE